MKVKIGWLAFFAELCAGLVLAYFAAILLLPYAYEVRGYRAVGGEWLLILAAGVAGCWMIHRLLLWIGGPPKKGKKRAPAPGCNGDERIGKTYFNQFTTGSAGCQ